MFGKTLAGCTALLLAPASFWHSDVMVLLAGMRGKQENGQRQTHCLEPWESTVLHFLLLLLRLICFDLAMIWYDMLLL